MTRTTFHLSASADDDLYVVTCHSVTRRTAKGARTDTVCAGTITRMGEIYAAELHGAGSGQAATPIGGPFHSLDAAQRAIERHYEHRQSDQATRRRRAPRQQKAR